MFLIFCVLFVWSSQNVGAECPAIISRKEWDAVKPDHVQYLTTPVDLVIIQHTVTRSCSDEKSCTEIVRDLQKTHIEKSFLWDISESFLIAGTGKVYEGRGWNRVAIHTFGYNNQSFGIGFIGNFNNQEPTTKALEAALSLIQCGIEMSWLSPNCSVLIHSQLLNTESPGKKLAKKIMSWTNWKQDISDILKRVDVRKLKEELNVPQSKDISPILTTPKQIDTLGNLRDAIKDVISKLRDLATSTLNLCSAFAKELEEQSDYIIGGITSSLRDIKDKFTTAVSSLGIIPGLGKCVDPLKVQANAVYDKTETKARACADEKIKEVDEMIRTLSTLASNAISFANTAAKETRNCTELNIGIQPVTKSCLNNVSTQTQTFTNQFETQKTLSVKLIETSLKSLPAAIQLCAATHINEATTETTKLSMKAADCATPSLFNPFG